MPKPEKLTFYNYFESAINTNTDKRIRELIARGVAKKVLDGINYKGEDTKLCPNCKRNPGIKNSNFCHHCGQKLDWTEE